MPSNPSVKNRAFSRKKFIVGLIILAIVIVGAIPVYFLMWSFKDSHSEKIIDREFHDDIQQYPNVKTTKFTLWEGDSIVTLDIPEKGQVRFWYGVDQVPRIESIGKYNSLFTCYNVDNNGKKVSYAYDTTLWLDSTSPYAKWFPFQVKTIGSLITHFEDIEHILSTFPKNPKLVNFNDSMGDRQIIKTSNPDFLLKPNKGKDSPICDLYIQD